MKIGLYIGRFQPLHNGHYEVIKKMNQENDLSYCIIIRGKKSSLDKNLNPFSLDSQIKMFSSSLRNFKNIGLSVFENAFMPKIIGFLTRKDDYVKLYIGPDRFNSYKQYIQMFKNFEIITCDFNRKNISGSMIRDLINQKQFNQIPNHIPYPIEILLNCS